MRIVPPLPWRSQNDLLLRGGAGPIRAQPIVWLDAFLSDASATSDEKTGVTDVTSAVEAAIAAIGTRRGTIVVSPGLYLVADGIEESTLGITLVGMGRATGVGPSATQMQAYGVAFKATTAGVWTWTHKGSATASAFNVYEGGFEARNIGFWGDGDTAGGLLIQQQNNVRIESCQFAGHTTGAGFRIQSDPESLITSGWDQSWLYMTDCVALNCLTGYDIGGPYAVSSGSTLVNLHTLKNTAGGIESTGSGVLIRSGNVTVLGGKCEGDANGWHVTAGDGVALTGVRAERCTNGIHLDRGGGAQLRVASATTTVITLDDGQLAVNQYQGGGITYTFVIESGTGSPASKTVLSNTKTTITLSSALALAPDTSSVIRVCPSFGSRHKVVAPIISPSCSVGVLVSAYNSNDAIVAAANSATTKITDNSGTATIVGESGGPSSKHGATFAGDTNIYRDAANLLKTDDVFQAGDGTYNGGHLRLGEYRLWVDGSGNLRIKSGSPSSATDGTIVGTQA